MSDSYDSSDSSVEAGGTDSGAASSGTDASVDVPGEYTGGDAGVDVPGEYTGGDAGVDVPGEYTEGDAGVDVPGEVETPTGPEVNAETPDEVVAGDENSAESDEDSNENGDASEEDPAKTEEDGAIKNSLDEETEENEEAEDDGKLDEYLEKESPYSSEVNEHISSKEELEVYKQAGLVETEINGRTCLIRGDLDMNYVDEESGLTNEERIKEGLVPIDPETGEKIELHHIGQDFDSPFAELTKVSEHDKHSKELHTSDKESWRRDSSKVNQYNAQRRSHWKTRAKEE